MTCHKVNTRVSLVLFQKQNIISIPLALSSHYPPAVFFLNTAEVYIVVVTLLVPRWVGGSWLSWGESAGKCFTFGARRSELHCGPIVL